MSVPHGSAHGRTPHPTNQSTGWDLRRYSGAGEALKVCGHAGAQARDRGAFFARVGSRRPMGEWRSVRPMGECGVGSRRPMGEWRSVRPMDEWRLCGVCSSDG
eukprot:6354192-Prymnesium_polylepis.1